VIRQGARLNMELNKVFEFAVILAWEDLMKASESCSVRVEYRCEPGSSLDCVSIWSVNAGGRQDLVCDYWTWASAAHPVGVRFRNGHYSDRLALTLDFIMKNQAQFTRHADACGDGLVLIYPPTEDELTEASRWMGEVQGTATNFGGAADERVPLSWMSLNDRRLGGALL
jgi:hypothetical protein